MEGGTIAPLCGGWTEVLYIVHCTNSRELRGEGLNGSIVPLGRVGERGYMYIRVLYLRGGGGSGQRY